MPARTVASGPMRSHVPLRAKLRRNGNSLSVIVPRWALDRIGASEGDEIDLELIAPQQGAWVEPMMASAGCLRDRIGTTDEFLAWRRRMREEEWEKVERLDRERERAWRRGPGEARP